MTVAIASGKGGTGKTLLAVNLSYVSTGELQLLDCDVEAPNTHLFLPLQNKRTEPVHRMIPQIDASLCTLCGECSRFCAFHALAVLRNKVVLFPELCHSCGGCNRVCRLGAVGETTEPIGEIIYAETPYCCHVQGFLQVGTAIVPPLIHRVTEYIQSENHTIIDASPGTGCAAMAALSPADFVVLAAEPTPFGLHDMRRLVLCLRELNKPFSVVVNRAVNTNDVITEFCRNEDIPILARIPDDRRITDCCAVGEITAQHLPEYHEMFLGIYSQLFGGAQ